MTGTSTALQVTVPANAAGPVTVFNPDGQEVRLSDAYTYVASPAPNAAAVEPAQGGAVGGAVVTIRGENLHPNATVRFGEALVTAVVLDADGSTLRATTPPHAAGTVKVTVTNPDGQASVAQASFTFYAADGASIPSPTEPAGSPATASTKAKAPALGILPVVGLLALLAVQARRRWTKVDPGHEPSRETQPEAAHVHGSGGAPRFESRDPPKSRDRTRRTSNRR